MGYQPIAFEHRHMQGSEKSVQISFKRQTEKRMTLEKAHTENLDCFNICNVFPREFM